MHHEALSEQNKKLFPLLKSFTEFYLAGGTALALQIGHRVSVDFDLFSPEGIEKTLLSKIKQVFSDFSVRVSVNNHEELTVFIDDTKVTFLSYAFPILLDLVSYEGVRLLGIKEIAATKAYTIGRRGSFKDYVDLYFIFSEGYSSIEEVIALAEQKYKVDFNGRLFLEQLVYLADIEDTEIELLRDGPKDKVALEKFFSDEIRKIRL